MWDQYRPDGTADEPEQPASQGPTRGPARRPARDPGLGRSGGPGPRRSTRTGAHSPLAGPLIGAGLLAVAAVTGIAVANSQDAVPAQEDHADFYACVAEYGGDDTGLLTPEDLCRIGNDAPPEEDRPGDDVP